MSVLDEHTYSKQLLVYIKFLGILKRFEYITKFTYCANIVSSSLKKHVCLRKTHTHTTHISFSYLKIDTKNPAMS